MSIFFTPQRAKSTGIASMKSISDICPSVCVAAMFLTLAASR